jgi:hypothetical protein
MHGEVSIVGRTFVIEHMVIHRGEDVGVEEPAVDAPSPAAMAALAELLSPAMASACEQTPPATSHTHPPLHRGFLQRHWSSSLVL